MQTLFEEGWYGAAKKLPSPFFNLRPKQEISLIVIHNISLPKGCYNTGFVEQLFQGQLDCQQHASFADLAGLEVSSHFFISRQGALTQFVSTLNRAWHAGVSEFNHRQNCNDFSIGIELEGSDDEPFADKQYLTLAKLSRDLIATYAIDPAYIVGHSDIAPARKTDPGPYFNWSYYRSLL